jgi:LPPG:FO 2-phospho-L-lactate transferase
MVLDPDRRVVALAGGVGGAKLALGLSRILPPDRLTVIGNVADDFELYGLHISPDLDTLMYTLAGVANPVTGWGVVDDTRGMLDMLRRYGEEAWFWLGDCDVATHLLRTHWLAQGIRLTEVTHWLASGLGVQHRLLPVTDDPVATMVDTVEHGTLGFQEYFVRWRWQPTARRVWFRGIEQAQVTEEVAVTLREARLIVFCPSNPVLSIEPILAVPGVREALKARRGPCVAISPFVAGKAVKGPASKLMPELGLGISPDGLLRYYAGVLDGLVIDESDCDDLPSGDTPVLVTPTLMKSDEDKVRLAEKVIEWAGMIEV